jgi:membrane protein
MPNALSSLHQRLRALALQWAGRAWAPLARTPAGSFAADTALAVRALARGFQGESLDNIHLRAAALTYISVFSLVPLLTVVVALLGAYHQEAFQHRLRVLISAVLAPGVREESAAFLERFLSPGNTTAIGSAGFLALLFSAGSLLHNIEASLNDTWGVRNRRPWLLRLAIYAGLLLLGPLMLALSFTGTGVVRSFLASTQPPLLSGLFERLFGFLWPMAAVGGLTLVYYVTPNTHVRFRSSLAGGLVAGVTWGLARQVYTQVAAYSFRHNPLYASLGALPMFLAWLYVDWLLILVGARLSYAVEHASFRDSLWAFGSHPRARELVGARLAQQASLCWYEGGSPPLPRELARQLRVPEPLLLEVVDDLEKAGLVERHRRGGILPASPPSDLTLADLTLALHGVYNPLEPNAWNAPRAPGFESLAAFFQEADQSGLEVLRRTRWVDLAELVCPGLATAPAPAPPESLSETGNP